MLPLAFAVIAVLSLALRIRNPAHHSFDIRQDVFLSHLRLDSLFFGVLLSYFAHYEKVRFQTFARRYAPLLVGLGLISLAWPFCFALEDTPWISTYGFSILYIGSGALLLGLLGLEPFLQSQPLKMLARMGAHSYSIYLWHIPIVRWVVPRIFNDQAPVHLRVLLYLILSIAVGWILSMLFENPFLRLRDRFFPSCARQPIAPPNSLRPGL